MFAKTFRNTLFASSLLIGASLLAGPAALAQVSDGGDVDGTVEAISTVDYTAPAAVVLSPTAGNADMNFGSVNVQDNSIGGWTLSVASANGGTLAHLTDPAEIAYTGLTFTSDDFAPVADVDVSAGTPVPVYTPIVLTCAATGGCDAALTADIAIADIDGKPVGTYRDTLTFTLTSN